MEYKPKMIYVGKPLWKKFKKKCIDRDVKIGNVIRKLIKEWLK